MRVLPGRLLHTGHVAHIVFLLGTLASFVAPASGETLSEEFEKLWQLVVVEKAARNVPMEDVTPVRRVCQYGLGEISLDTARTVLTMRSQPPEVLEFHDIDDSGPEADALLRQLQAEFGNRVQVAERRGSLTSLGDPGDAYLLPAHAQPCDLAIVSKDSPRFTIERLLHRAAGARYIAVAWISKACITAEGNTQSPSCGFLNTFWQKTLLMRRGYCLKNICMSRVPVTELVDPNTFPLDCAGITGRRGPSASQGWTSPAAEFSQDWYVLWNYYRNSTDKSAGWQEGLYVDVGASMPFEYSNTVVLERCFGWRGLCIEANPGLLPWLHAYRDCQIIHNCVTAEAISDRVFGGRDGGYAFSTDCRTLQDILVSAGLQGQRIDMLSIDVEHGELGVLQGVKLEDFDIRVIVIEVGRGARWLEVETVLLQRGYAKVAVLGRDAVYVKLEEVTSDLAVLSDSPDWRRHAGAFLPGYAADDGLERSAQDSKERCVELGNQCAGITCSSFGDMCTVRAGTAMYESPINEVSHAKAADVPPVVSRGSVVLPPGWRDFHQRVVDEELAAEMVMEREAAAKGLRRFATQS